jgi:hypothetical protein
MAAIAKIFSLLALAGFVVSSVAHFAGYVGIERPFGINPWPLHVVETSHVHCPECGEYVGREYQVAL